jgi:hypothetical protein
VKLNFAELVQNWIVNEVALVPVGFALALKLASHTSWQPTLVVWLGAPLPAIAGLVVLERAARTYQSRSGIPPHPGDTPRDVRMVARGAALLLLAELVVVFGLDWRAGVVFAALLAGWVLWWAPASRRRITVTAPVHVRCSPGEAFDLVSNPSNWPRYLPQLELVGSPDLPIRLGSIVRARVREGDAVILESDEVVTAFEPDSRFATRVVGAPGQSTSTWDMKASGDGTDMVYTYSSVWGLASMVLGGAFRRTEAMRRIAQNRAASNERLARELESEPSPRPSPPRGRGS